MLDLPERVHAATSTTRCFKRRLKTLFILIPVIFYLYFSDFVVPGRPAFVGLAQNNLIIIIYGVFPGKK